MKKILYILFFCLSYSVDVQFEPFPSSEELCANIDCNNDIGENVIFDNTGNYFFADFLYILFYSSCSCSTDLCFPSISAYADPILFNFNPEVNIDDGNSNYAIITELKQSFDTWNESIYLSRGYNMFGYGCPNPILHL